MDEKDSKVKTDEKDTMIKLDEKDTMIKLDDKDIVILNESSEEQNETSTQQNRNIIEEVKNLDQQMKDSKYQTYKRSTSWNQQAMGDNSKQEKLLKEILESLKNIEAKMEKIESILKEQKPSKNWIG